MSTGRITVSTSGLDICFRTNGIEQIVEELQPIEKTCPCMTPRIIEAILRGDEPDGLSLEKLRKNLDLPMRWEEQRKVFGKALMGNSIPGGPVSGAWAG